MKSVFVLFTFASSLGGSSRPFGQAYASNPSQRRGSDVKKQNLAHEATRSSISHETDSLLFGNSKKSGRTSRRSGLMQVSLSQLQAHPPTSRRDSLSPFSRYGLTSPVMTPKYAAVSLASQLITRKRQEEMGENSRGSKATATSLRGGGGMTMAAASIAPPSWLFPAVSCATAYALYNLFIKKSASQNMDPILGGVILQFVAALMGSLLYAGKHILASSGKSATTTISRAGVTWSVAAGVAVGAAELLSFIVSGKGVPATQSIPIIIGGSIVVGTIVGAAWLQERLAPRGWFGVALIAAGIVLVGMDPSSGMGH